MAVGQGIIRHGFGNCGRKAGPLEFRTIRGSRAPGLPWFRPGVNCAIYQVGWPRMPIAEGGCQSLRLT